MIPWLLRFLVALLHLAAAVLTLRALDLLPESAEPTTVVHADAAIEELASPAMAAIRFPWEERLPGWTVEFVPGDGAVAGYTWTREQRIEIFVRPGATSADLTRILAHEIGHAIDVTHNNGDDRRRWQASRGIADAPWWPGSGAADFATGAGDFAEAFAVWEVGAADYRGELAPAPTAAQLDLLMELAYD